MPTLAIRPFHLRPFHVGAFVKMRGRALRSSPSPLIRPCCHQHAYGDPQANAESQRGAGLTRPPVANPGGVRAISPGSATRGFCSIGSSCPEGAQAAATGMVATPGVACAPSGLASSVARHTTGVNPGPNRRCPFGAQDDPEVAHSKCPPVWNAGLPPCRVTPLPPLAFADWQLRNSATRRAAVRRAP